MLLIRDYLLAGGSASELLTKHGVNAKPYNGKVSFVYDQLASERADLLARQCRGLILRENATWDIVAYPFDRFFNHDEKPFVADLDWSTASFEEKLDGTLLIVYWDDAADRWMCATRSMCEAHGNINGLGSFSNLADECVRFISPFKNLHEMMEGRHAARDVTYMFELTGPDNRVVCEYRDLGLTLLGARRLSDFAELDPVTLATTLCVRTPKRWEFSNLDHLREAIREWDPLTYEGVVVKDDTFQRVKVKAPLYLAVAHLTDSIGASWRSCLELVRSGKDDDVIGHAPPRIADRIRLMRDALETVVRRAETDLASLAGVDDMKTFAFAAQKTKWSAPLFAVKRNKTESVSAFAKECFVDGLLDLCMAEITEELR